MSYQTAPGLGLHAYRASGHYGTRDGVACRLYLRHGIAAGGEPAEVGLWVRIGGYGDGPAFVYGP